VARLGRALPASFLARVVGVMGLVGAGFLAFILFTSNPFDRLLPAAMDGADLNPLLQDPALALHPPLLYMGYVGFSVAFAFAIAALLEGRVDVTWARWSRPWTAAAWSFLTLGIALGSWWAYYELGWGGWWFWDPVENASFMPWLIGTALLHSLAVTEKRGSFKSWTLLLAIAAFALSLLGTFLVRSGVLTSVHAFASDPARGTFILIFLVVVVGTSLALYAWRAPGVGLGSGFHLFSRETLLLVNNVLLAAAAATVLLGTLYPLGLDALGLGKVSVGPPYFETVFVPLMAPVLFLMGAGPLARWNRAQLPELTHRLRWALASGVIAAVGVPLVTGRGSVGIALGLLLGFWILVAVVMEFRLRVRRDGQWQRPRLAHLGMACAHLGVGLFVVGVTLSGGYGSETEQRLAPGESARVGGHEFRFDGVRETTGPNYAALEATLTVTRDGRTVAVLHPEKRNYQVQSRMMTEAAIDTGFTRHLYAALGEPADDGAWGVRLYHKPFVQWIWIGALAIALGGLLAALDRRYRITHKEATE